MRHLIDIRDLSPAEIAEILDRADDIIAHPDDYRESCRYKKLATLFFEPSTRTRLSFEAAMMELGGNVLGFSEAASSSASKGESVSDTVRVVGCYADIIAMRHPKEGAPLAAALHSTVPIINAGDGNAVLGKEWHICRGKGTFESEDCGIRFSAGANTFLQVNDGVRTILYEAVKRAACSPEAAAIDLYSGGGMLTAMLAGGCRAAYGIEIVPEAVACADELAKKNGLAGKMHNLCGAVEDRIGEVLSATRDCERVIVCDPPRKGMERSVVREILKSGARKAVLVSCNPATLARDMGLLCGSLIEDGNKIIKNPAYIPGQMPGFYDIVSVTPFDMFPQTKHVETLVCLERITVK